MIWLGEYTRIPSSAAEQPVVLVGQRFESSGVLFF